MKNLDLNIIHTSFFERSTEKVARDLIDKYLVTERSGKLCGGKVVETEAYLGQEDKASHAYVGITSRNKVMYGKPGCAYVYFIYGMYYCFNVVSEKEGVPGAVLIRAIEPEIGVEEMKIRRGKSKLRELAAGPAKLTQALKIDMSDNGTSLLSKSICFMDNGKKQRPFSCSSRIGISKSNHREYRFFVRNNKFVS